MDVKDLYMAKIAFNPECNIVYLIGGAKDQKSKMTVPNMKAYHISDRGI